MARKAMGRVGLSLLVLGVTLARGAPAAAANEDPESLIRQGVELRRKGQAARAEGTLRRATDRAPPPPAVVEPAANTVTATGTPSAQPPETHDAPAASPSGRGLRIAGITVGAVGVAVGILGGVLYAEGSSRRDEYRDAINSNGK